MKKKLLLLYFLMATCVAKTQNIGIGTLSPNAKLSVSATGTDLTGPAMSNNFRTNSGSLGSNTGDEISLASIGFIAGSNNTSLGIRAYRSSIGTSWSSTSLLLEYDVDNVARVSSGFLALGSNGNIGIGTTTPGDKLTILSSDNNTVTNIGAFYPANLTQGIGIGYNEIRKLGTTANSDLFINAKGSGNLILENSATGNVGIGISSLAAKLQVTAGDESFALFGPNASYGAMLYVGASPSNHSAALTAQVFASDGNLHLDPAVGKNIYMGYFQARDIYLNSNGGNIGIGTTSAPTAKLEVNGYTKLGSNAPSIKVKKLTGTTAAMGGNNVLIAHGLDASKILSVSVMVLNVYNELVEPNYGGSGSNFNWIEQSGYIWVYIVSGDSANILSKPIKILITYEE